MSDDPHGPDADGIEQGKRLIRIAGDKGLSLAERLSGQLQRLAWRTPLHALKLRGRYPLKLIAVPDDPLPGDVARGEALMAGKLSYRGETRAFRDIGPGQSRAFDEYWQYFAWLRDLSTVATRAQAAPVAEELMDRWLDAHADMVSEPAWRPDLWGRRILFWTSHAPLILSSADIVYRSRVLNTLARGARHLERGAEKVPPGLPRIAAWAGTIAAGLLIPGGEPRRAAGEAGLAKAIAGSIYEDGGNLARSPAAQAEIVAILAMLRETYAARRIEPPANVGAVIDRMVPALLGVTLGDRALSSWQGGGPSTPERVSEVIAASGVRTRPLRQARDWGYQRLAAGKTVLVLDAAPPPVGRGLDGGCASTLAFEMSDGEARLIVNCGGARAASAQLPAALVNGLRSTAAHSTLTVAYANSTAVHADGSLGRGVAEVELNRQESETASRIEASHDGYARRMGFLHRRTLTLSSDGRELKGEDQLLPAPRSRRTASRGFAIRFHLGRGVEATATADGMGALLRVPGGGLWQFRCRGAALAVDDSLWIDGAGRPIATRQLVVGGEAAPGGASISWALKRAN